MFSAGRSHLRCFQPGMSLKRGERGHHTVHPLALIFATSQKSFDPVSPMSDERKPCSPNCRKEDLEQLWPLDWRPPVVIHRAKPARRAHLRSLFATHPPAGVPSSAPPSAAPPSTAPLSTAQPPARAPPPRLPRVCELAGGRTPRATPRATPGRMAPPAADPSTTAGPPPAPATACQTPTAASTPGSVPGTASGRRVRRPEVQGSVLEHWATAPETLDSLGRVRPPRMHTYAVGVLPGEEKHKHQKRVQFAPGPPGPGAWQCVAVISTAAQGTE